MAESREELFEVLRHLQTMVAFELRRPLIDSMELQYLRYPGDGGFYGKHHDHSPFDDQNIVQRSISILLYLNDRQWDADSDGGVLRAYPKGQPAVEVVPKGGTLVLFDSKMVEHEVLPTNSERFAVVGWFHAKNRNPKKKKVCQKVRKRKR